MKFCKQCKNEFEITETDKEFYHKMDVPEPERCSVCRARRRLSFRNERTFYKDTCKNAIKKTLSNT